MSILIKGMTMPKNCGECPIMILEDTNCLHELFWGCPIVFEASPQGKAFRPNYCPLIKVKPHGRLIDADALMEQIMIITKDRWVYNTISHAPTIIEAEVSEL